MKIYFKGITALRFLAAAAVIVTHVELLKNSYDLPNLWQEPIFFELGSFGVYFFFVLSGFLITYLLLAEKKESGTVAVKQFYMRRILRIWPLYFLIVALGFFVLPHIQAISLPYFEKNLQGHFGLNLFFYLIILPNLGFAFFGAVPHIGQTWSIGVEEQFYIVWPWVIRKVRNVLKTLLIGLIIIIALKALVWFWCRMSTPTPLMLGLKNLVAMSKFENMIIGAIGAWLVYENKEKVLAILHNTWLFAGCLVLVPVIIYLPLGPLQDMIHLVYSVLFVVIILNFIKRVKAGSFWEKPLWLFLGNISYGIYMYHMMVIPCVLMALKPMGLGRVAFNVWLYVLSFAFSILISALSYRYFEKPFLGLKQKFSKLKTPY